MFSRFSLTKRIVFVLVLLACILPGLAGCGSTSTTSQRHPIVISICLSTSGDFSVIPASFNKDMSSGLIRSTIKVAYLVARWS